MNTKFSPFSIIWFRRFLPLLFLGLVVGIESGATYFFGHQTLAPLLSILSLSILAFYCSSRLLLLFAPSTALYSTFYDPNLPAYSRSLPLSLSPDIYRPSWWNPFCLGQLLPQQTPTSANRDRDHRESYAYPLVACRRIWKSASIRS